MSRTFTHRSYTIRHLEDYDEYRLIGEIQRETWGEDPVEYLSPALLAVTHKIGGIIAAAFSDEGEAIGFVYGLPGKRGGKDIHWSHMLAVVPSRRGEGIGRALKEFQKEFVQRQGIRYINWTFDPLEAVNARLNVSRLGAMPTEYACDLYGDGSFSKLSRLIGTDRLIVTWFLHEKDKQAYLSRFYQPPSIDHIEQVITQDLSFRQAVDDARAVRIRIPANIQQLKVEHPERAVKWKRAMRVAFEHYMGLHYTVQSIQEDAITKEVEYILTAPLN